MTRRSPMSARRRRPDVHSGGARRTWIDAHAGLSRTRRQSNRQATCAWLADRYDEATDNRFGPTPGDSSAFTRVPARAARHDRALPPRCSATFSAWTPEVLALTRRGCRSIIGVSPSPAEAHTAGSRTTRGSCATATGERRAKVATVSHASAGSAAAGLDLRDASSRAHRSSRAPPDPSVQASRDRRSRHGTRVHQASPAGGSRCASSRACG